MDKTTWQLWETGPVPPAENMALDEALLLQSISEPGPPILRLYAWSTPCVTIGYAQDMHEVVNMQEAARRGVTVIRRATGGGAVVHDAELTYGLCAERALFGGNTEESFRAVAQPLILGLAELGMDAVFSPINDLLIDGKKISGSARVERRGMVLQHGTILLDADKEGMFRLLNVAREKVQGRGLSRASDRITSAAAVLGRKLTYREAADAMIHGFEKWFGAPAMKFPHEEELRQRARSIEQEKYSNPEWNLRRIHKSWDEAPPETS